MSVNIKNLFITAEETEVPEDAVVKGNLPDWLSGTYYRVGPSKFDLKDFTLNHMLDGYGMITKFQITPKKVTMEKKYLQSDAYKRATEAGRPVITEFGTSACSDPNKSLLARFATALVPEFSDNGYSTLSKFGPDLVSISDTCYLRSVDTQELGNSPHKYDSNKLFGINGQSSHPLTDGNGDVWNIGTSFFPSLSYKVIKFPHSKSSKEMLKQGKVIVTIPSRWNGSLGTFHSFGMSENHLILVEQPLVISLSKLCGALVKKTSVKDWMEWRAEDRNRFVILGKDGKINKIEYFSKDSFFFMHTINSFEEEGQIVLDILTYKSHSILDTWWLENLRKNIINPTDFPQFHRYVIPVVDDIKKIPEDENLVKVSSLKHKATAVRRGSRIILTPEVMVEERGLECPCINELYRYKRNRFTYVAAFFHETWFRNKICKIDSETKEVLEFKENGFVFPGEPIFIPRPGGKEEDDGIIVSAVSDTREEHLDFLLFLDRNLKEIGRAQFQERIPMAFHGIFSRNV